MMNFTIPYGLTNPVIKLSLKLESIPKTFAIFPAWEDFVFRLWGDA